MYPAWVSVGKVAVIDVAVAVPATCVPPSDTVVHDESSVPVRVNTVPDCPAPGEIAVSVGGGRIVKGKLLVGNPLQIAMTEYDPLASYHGTDAVIVELVELEFTHW